MNPYRKDVVELLRMTWRERLWLGSHRYTFAFTMVSLIPAFCFAIAEELVARDRDELRYRLDTANETIRRQSAWHEVNPPVKPLTTSGSPIINVPTTIMVTHDVKSGEVLCPCKATTNTYCFVSPTDAGMCPEAP